MPWVEGAEKTVSTLLRNRTLCNHEGMESILFL